MKRIFKYLIFSILLIFPFIIKAEGIENYFINATVQESGDLLVEEYFYLNGEFNGFERIIEYRNDNSYPFDANMESYGGSDIHNGSGIVIHEIKGLDINPNFDFSNTYGDNFTEVDYAERGDYGVYTETNNYNGVSLLIYNPNSKNKAFYIKYTLKDMAIMHNDVAEIGWNIVGNELTESVAHLKAYVNFPNNQNDLKGWAHGPLKGQITILNNRKLEVKIDEVTTTVPYKVTYTTDETTGNRKVQKPIR